MIIPRVARIYVGLMIAAGAVAVIAGIGQWTSPNLSRYICYCLLAFLGSALKVQLPGFNGNISLNFLFILVGVAELSFSETVLLGAGAALLQSVCRTARRPQALQVAFNVAAVAVSIAVADRVSHQAQAALQVQSLALLMATAAILYFVSNTMIVAAVISLVEHKRWTGVWQQCYLWTFPYYIAGAGIAGLIAATSRAAGWKAPLLLLPCAYLVYLYYRLHVERAASRDASMTASA
jgi:hypothetical protein